MAKAKQKPGTERFRDEKRPDDKPKMHGTAWHDHPPQKKPTRRTKRTKRR
jgi:hypothetical protein